MGALTLADNFASRYKDVDVCVETSLLHYATRKATYNSSYTTSWSHCVGIKKLAEP